MHAFNESKMKHFIYLENSVDYFEKQYFSNPEYFKRKIHEDDHWNMSEKLFMKHHE